MKISRLLIFITGLASALSCENNDIGRQWSYLPLETGNYWTFSNSFKREITGTEKVHGKEYFVMVSSGDTSFLRTTKNKVLVLKPGQSSKEEAMMFDIHARVKDKWKFNEWEITLQNDTASVFIGDSVIRNCKQYYFDIPATADEEYNLWLAPGVGFIQTRCLGECVGTYNKITAAKIGGVIPAFLTGSYNRRTQP